MIRLTACERRDAELTKKCAGGQSTASVLGEVRDERGYISAEFLVRERAQRTLGLIYSSGLWSSTQLNF